MQLDVFWHIHVLALDLYANPDKDSITYVCSVAAIFVQ